VDQEVNSPATLIGGTVADELASQRTELSFEQAAMGSDNALLASVRTSMALITFGFIIFEYLQKISEEQLAGSLPAHSPRRFGLALLVLGVVLLCFEILRHKTDRRVRRQRRQELFERGLIRHPEMARPNSAMIVAILLLLVGLAAIFRVALSAGPL
jgi:putative membrane protein